MNDYIVKVAERVARKSNMKQKVAAVIFIGEEVLGTDYNRWLGNSKVCLYGVPVWSRHAEIGVVRRVYKKYGPDMFPECSIYVHRLGGKFAKPCGHCAQVISMMGFKGVYWSGGRK